MRNYNEQEQKLRLQMEMENTHLRAELASCAERLTHQDAEIQNLLAQTSAAKVAAERIALLEETLRDTVSVFRSCNTYDDERDAIATARLVLTGRG